LAPDRPQAEELLRSRVTAIGYERVTDAAGKLPLLAGASSPKLISARTIAAMKRGPVLVDVSID